MTAYDCTLFSWDSCPFLLRKFRAWEAQERFLQGALHPKAPNTRTNTNTAHPLGLEGCPFPVHSVSSNPTMSHVGGQSMGAPTGPSDIDSGNPSCTLRLAYACWAGLDLLSLCLPSGNTEKGDPDRVMR